MLQNSRIRRLSGFTLTEMLVGMAIAIVGIAATISVYVMICQVWKDDLVTNELSRNGNIAIEKMLHGTTGNAGLLAAKSITSPTSGASDDEVTYLDSNDVSRRFYYSSGHIYAALGAATGDVILSDVDSVTFSYNGQTLLISLALHKTSGSKEINVSMETRVYPRN
jgi:Tfp pilus assembly protein PilW